MASIAASTHVRRVALLVVSIVSLEGLPVIAAETLRRVISLYEIERRATGKQPPPGAFSERRSATAKLKSAFSGFSAPTYAMACPSLEWANP